MPSSDYNSIPKVLQVVNRIGPLSILDVGVGTGRYGFLFREILDFNYGRFNRSEWHTRIDGVEIDASYILDHHKGLYSIIYNGDFNQVELPGTYNLIFMGDVLEHWADGQWQMALKKAKLNSDILIVVAPNNKESMNQGVWRGHESERHLSLLSPEKVGGKCLFANSKFFMCGFDNRNIGILDDWDICL